VITTTLKSDAQNTDRLHTTFIVGPMSTRNCFDVRKGKAINRNSPITKPGSATDYEKGNYRRIVAQITPSSLYKMYANEACRGWANVVFRSVHDPSMLLSMLNKTQLFCRATMINCASVHVHQNDPRRLLACSQWFIRLYL